MSKGPGFQEFHDENSSQRSTTHLAPASQSDVQPQAPVPEVAGPNPAEVKKLKRLQYLLMGACLLLWLFIIIVIIVYATRTRCSTTKSISDDAIIVEATSPGNVPYTVVLYVQNWFAMKDCYRGWSNTPTSKPEYTIGTLALYDWNGTAVSNYRELFQQRYDAMYGAIFSFGAVAQEGGNIHFIVTLADQLYPVLYTYNLASGSLTNRTFPGYQWGFITFGLDTTQPYLYYLDSSFNGYMRALSGSVFTDTWFFNDASLLFPEAAGYFNDTMTIANAVPSSTSSAQVEVDYQVFPGGVSSPYVAPWQGLLGASSIAVYFDVTDPFHVLLGPMADLATGKRPGDSCQWYTYGQGGLTAANQSWETQLCDGAIFEEDPSVNGYTLVDIANKVVITIPYLNDWQIVAVTWIAQPAYRTELWFDPSRGSRPTEVRPFVLVNNSTQVYLPGYFPPGEL